MRNTLFAFVFLVVACAGVTPQQQVYAIQRDFEEALVELEAYAFLPECAPEVLTACYDQDVLNRLVDAADHADAALDEAEAIVRDPAMSDNEVAAYTNVARVSLSRLVTILISEGILDAS